MITAVVCVPVLRPTLFPFIQHPSDDRHEATRCYEYDRRAANIEGGNVKDRTACTYRRYLTTYARVNTRQTLHESYGLVLSRGSQVVTSTLKALTLPITPQVKNEDFWITLL